MPVHARDSASAWVARSGSATGGCCASAHGGTLAGDTIGAGGATAAGGAAW